jgi:hypothetical protein
MSEQALSPWSKEDLKQLEQLDALLSKKVEWNLNTSELVQAYRSLVWLASLKKKIDDSLVEIISVKQVNPPTEPVQE